MPRNIQPVMLRYHSKTFMDDASVMLFLPDMDVNPGMIMCYAHIGQHSEASMAYYWETKPIHHAPARYQAEGRDLLKEYKQICKAQGEEMQVVFKDAQKFRDARYGWMKKGKS